MSIDVVAALAGLGIRNARRSGNEVSFSCPLPAHGAGDRRPSARMNARTTAWICHGCKASGGNMRDLIVLIHGGDPRQIDDVEDEVRRLSYRRPTGTVLDEINAIIGERKLRRTREPLPEFPDYDRYLIDWHLVRAAMDRGEPVGALIYPFERGFSADTLNDYDIGWDPETNRMLLPIHDETGALIGVKGRATGPSRSKYLIMGDPYPKSEIVYLLHSASGRLVVCEGELNALACRQAGVTGAVAVGGSDVSARQIDLLVSRAGRGVVLFFDDDKAGQEGTARLARAISPFSPVTVVGPHEGDPASMTPDVILQHINESTAYASYALERSLHG